jgi:hypothetical protein
VNEITNDCHVNRPRILSDVPIRFVSRDQPNNHFTIQTQKVPIARYKVASYIFHPTEPFIITAQQTLRYLYSISFQYRAGHDFTTATATSGSSPSATAVSASASTSTDALSSSFGPLVDVISQAAAPYSPTSLSDSSTSVALPLFQPDLMAIATTATTDVATTSNGSTSSNNSAAVGGGGGGGSSTVGSGDDSSSNNNHHNSSSSANGNSSSHPANSTYVAAGNLSIVTETAAL